MSLESMPVNSQRHRFLRHIRKTEQEGENRQTG